MRSKTPSSVLAFAVVFMLGMSAIPTAPAQTFTSLYSFTDLKDGGYIEGNVVVDKDANIFGTATRFGANRGGTAWQLDSGGTLTVLHNFGIWDGSYPDGLTADKKGNLFGASYGGPVEGNVFSIGSGGTFASLYSFGTRPKDAFDIYGGVVLDSSENLYGTSFLGGTTGYGTVWRVSSRGSESILHNFTCPTDGCNPQFGNLYIDQANNIFGVAPNGGGDKCGTLFEISSNGTFSVLHTFNCSRDGAYPDGTVQRYKGMLYGTTVGGGKYNLGTVWQYDLTKLALTVLHDFSASDGMYPSGVSCKHGRTTDCATVNLFGTMEDGGTHRGGTVWEVNSRAKFRTLYNFCSLSQCADGQRPIDPPFVDKTGTLYGTTYEGGSHGPGTIWKITFP